MHAWGGDGGNLWTNAHDHAFHLNRRATANDGVFTRRWAGSLRNLTKPADHLGVIVEPCCLVFVGSLLRAQLLRFFP